jgi:hypothetical protein
MDELRYKVNREIKTVLVRNAADLSRLSFSFSGRTASIRGELIKVDNSQFPVSQIEELARDISRLPAVRELYFDLTNWDITSTGDSWQVFSKSKRGHEQDKRKTHQQKDDED